jgi:hypothetical protein
MLDYMLLPDVVLLLDLFLSSSPFLSSFFPSNIFPFKTYLHINCQQKNLEEYEIKKKSLERISTEKGK